MTGDPRAFDVRSLSAMLVLLSLFGTVFGRKYDPELVKEREAGEEEARRSAEKEHLRRRRPGRGNQNV